MARPVPNDKDALRALLQRLSDQVRALTNRTVVAVGKRWRIQESPAGDLVASQPGSNTTVVLASVAGDCGKVVDCVGGALGAGLGYDAEQRRLSARLSLDPANTLSFDGEGGLLGAGTAGMVPYIALANPGMEDAAPPWVPRYLDEGGVWNEETFSRVTVAARNGSYGTTTPEGGYDPGRQYPSGDVVGELTSPGPGFRVVPGHDYTGGMWVRVRWSNAQAYFTDPETVLPSGFRVAARLSIAYYDTGGGLLAVVDGASADLVAPAAPDVSGSASGEWAQVTVATVAPEGAVRGRLVLHRDITGLVNKSWHPWFVDADDATVTTTSVMADKQTDTMGVWASKRDAPAPPIITELFVARVFDTSNPPLVGIEYGNPGAGQPLIQTYAYKVFGASYSVGNMVFVLATAGTGTVYNTQPWPKPDSVAELTMGPSLLLLGRA